MLTTLGITIKTWNKEIYNEFVKYLVNLQYIKYKNLHSSIVLNSKYQMIGIRLPIMRDVEKIVKSNKESFKSRVGFVMILDHFINNNNINDIFDTLNKKQSDKFYINMAEAWLVCEMYIKYPKETKGF